MKKNYESNNNQEVLLKNLEIQWEDHIQTRNQTWKALQISVTLAIAIVGLEWSINN